MEEAAAVESLIKQRPLPHAAQGLTQDFESIYIILFPFKQPLNLLHTTHIQGSLLSRFHGASTLPVSHFARLLQRLEAMSLNKLGRSCSGASSTGSWGAKRSAARQAGQLSTLALLSSCGSNPRDRHFGS